MSRSDVEITDFIKTCYPDLNLVDNEDDEKEAEIKDFDDIETPRESAEDHRVYMEEIPRVREVYIRCDEKFASMDKITKNIFKIMTNVVTEINTVNEELYGLYDIENNEKPQTMENQWLKREEVCSFLTKWKKVEQNGMYCFYKYWLLNMKYEHQDCLAILDIFTRYDIVYNKYKRVWKEYEKLKKQVGKRKHNVSVVVEESEDKKEVIDDVVHDDQDQDKDEDKDKGDGIDEETKMKMKNIKTLLDTVCKVILREQIPKLWEKRANDFNDQIDKFREKYQMYTLGDDDFSFV